MSTVSERVAKGAAHLDQHDPDWWKASAPRAINLSALDLESSYSCILGQRCPLENPGNPYDAYLMQLTGGAGFAEREAWARAHGFQGADFDDGGDVDYDDYRELTAAWAGLIYARRAAA